MLLKRVNILIKINKHMNFNAPSFNQVSTIKKLGELEIVDMKEILNMPPLSPDQEKIVLNNFINNVRY